MNQHGKLSEVESQYINLKIDRLSCVTSEFNFSQVAYAQKVIEESANHS